MGFANIRRPQIIPRLNLENVLFWNKRTSDNIDAINAKMEYIELDITQAQQTLFYNPRREALPIGFIPVNSVIIADDDTETPSLPLEGFQLDLSRTDGQLGITVGFQAPNGVIALYKSANQTLTTGVTTALTWDVEDTEAGNLTHAASSSQIVCAVDGRVVVSYVISFVAQASTGRTAYFAKNGVTNVTKSRWGQSRILSPSDGGAAVLTGCQEMDVAANDYIEIWALQSSGGNLDVIGNASQECNVIVRYVAPITGYAATIRGFLVYA